MRAIVFIFLILSLTSCSKNELYSWRGYKLIESTDPYYFEKVEDEINKMPVFHDRSDVLKVKRLVYYKIYQMLALSSVLDPSILSDGFLEYSKKLNVTGFCAYYKESAEELWLEYLLEHKYDYLVLVMNGDKDYSLSSKAEDHFQRFFNLPLVGSVSNEVDICEAHASIGYLVSAYSEADQEIFFRVKSAVVADNLKEWIEEKEKQGCP